MSGFNRITQIQPARSNALAAPLGVSSHQSTGMIRQPSSTPAKRSLPHPASTTATPAKQLSVRNENIVYTTPSNKTAPPSNHHNAPMKKRSIESQRQKIVAQETLETRFHEVASPTLIDEIEPVDDSTYDDEYEFQANQLGMFDGLYQSSSQAAEDVNQESGGRVAFERVKEETVEMGGFILPGAEKKSVHKSYNWIAGRSDEQYRVVLGYNTLFKPKSKNGIDSSTGEKDSSRWRVVRFENRYKENYPYTEFPAKYLTPIIQALEKARETHDIELKEDSVL
jgi:hypothetical protein